MRPAKGTLHRAEREFLVRYLALTGEQLLDTVQGLNKEQQRYRLRDSWSVADCVEHVTLVEQGVFERIQAVLLEPPPSPAQTRSSLADEALMRRERNRSLRFASHADALPRRRWTDFEGLLRRFEAARERSLRFAAVTQKDLRGHAFAHPQFGELDCYQWLLFLGAHAERHALQATEVIAGARFPREADSATA